MSQNKTHIFIQYNKERHFRNTKNIHVCKVLYKKPREVKTDDFILSTTSINEFILCCCVLFGKKERKVRKTYRNI